jgi:hypothetical protein
MIDEESGQESRGEDAATQAVSEDWIAGLDGELASLAKLKGWKAPADALKSYRHLERLVGADKIALPGEGAGPEAWAQVWDRLGRPKAPEEYAFQPQTGLAYDSQTADWFRKQAHALGLTAAQATGLHDSYLQRLGAASPPPSGAAKTEQEPDVEAELRQAWGRRYQPNMSAAKRAFAAFLDGEGEFNDLADALGEVPLMRFLARIGAAIGEDSITARDPMAGFGLRSREEALGEIQRLQNEIVANPRHPYVSKMHPEHDSAVKRMEALFQAAYGG